MVSLTYLLLRFLLFREEKSRNILSLLALSHSVVPHNPHYVIRRVKGGGAA